MTPNYIEIYDDMVIIENLTDLSEYDICYGIKTVYPIGYWKPIRKTEPIPKGWIKVHESKYTSYFIKKGDLSLEGIAP